MGFQDHDGLALEEFSRRLAHISVYRHEQPVRELLALLQEHSGVQLVTLWKLVGDNQFACAIDRVGYDPDPNQDRTEYFCPVASTHIELFLKRDPFSDFQPWHIPSVSDLPQDEYFNTQDRIDAERLSSAYMIPLDVSSQGLENYFLNIYFDETKVNLASQRTAIEAISLKTSAIVMSAIDQGRSETDELLQAVSRDCVGSIEDFLEKITIKVLPNAILAKKFFLFTRDDASNNRYWQHSYDTPDADLEEETISEIADYLKKLNLREPSSFWGDESLDLQNLFGSHESFLVAPLVSRLDDVGPSGFIVICDALHKKALKDYSVSICKPFSAEQKLFAKDVCERSASLFDVYLHEHRRQNMTNVLAHEILSPSIYVKYTAARLLRKASGIDTRSRSELENIHNTAGLQVSVCEGIFLTNRSTDQTFDDKYSPTKIPVHSSFVDWRKFLYPTCENFGLDFDGIDINVMMPEIYFDLRALQVVFLNLCVNALKYSRDTSYSSSGFNLSVKGRSFFKPDAGYGATSRLSRLYVPRNVNNEGYFILTFQDNGIGVPPKYTNKIFDDYFRVETEHSSFRSGMGLGLSMVRRIVRDHCGDVWVSRAKDPTIFSVALPMFLKHEEHAIIKEQY